MPCLLLFFLTTDKQKMYEQMTECFENIKLDKRFAVAHGTRSTKSVMMFVVSHSLKYMIIPKSLNFVLSRAREDEYPLLSLTVARKRFRIVFTYPAQLCFRFKRIFYGVLPVVHTPWKTPSAVSGLRVKFCKFRQERFQPFHTVQPVLTGSAAFSKSSALGKLG